MEKRTMKRIITLFILLLIMVAAVPIGAAYADSLTDRIIKTGEEVNEDVAVYGGNLIIESGAVVNGDVLVFGGHAEIGGEIDGDVAIFGGNAELTGVVDGDLVIFGGSLDVSPQAEVDGECALLGGSVSGDGQDNINCAAVGERFPFSFTDSMNIPPIPPVPPVPAVPEVPPIPEPPTFHPPRVSPVGRFFNGVGEIAGRSLMLGLLALVMAVLLPTQLNQVSDVIVRKPVASGTVGVLTAMAGPFAIAILAAISGILVLACGLGLLGFPIVMIASLALGFGLLLGWIAVGTLIGEQLAGAMKLTNRSLPVVAALGTVVLTLLASALSELPFLLGGPLWTITALVIACAGLGAVALTKFGTRAYPVGATNSDKIAAVLETLPVEDADED
jgi:hypothetical protein